MSRGFLARKAMLRAGLPLMALTLLASACGSTTSATQSPSASSGAKLAQARSIVASATDGFVTANSLASPLVALTSWNGPSGSSPKVNGIKMIGVASCQDPCAYVGDLVGTLGKQYDGDTYSGSVGQTPEDWQSLTQQAINAKPAVIVFNGVADGAVTQQVQAARAAGIKTVGISVEQTVFNGGGYDAYVSVRQDVSYRLMVQAAIAASGGTAQMAIMEPSGYASTDRYVAQAVKDVQADCPGCSVFVQREDTSAMVDPTQMDSLVTSLLNSHPKVDYILFGDDFYALSAARTAAQRLGRTVHLIAQDGSTPGLEAVKSGLIEYDAGVPLEWIAYAGYDQIRRVVSGQTPLGSNSWGGGAHLWTAGNLPSQLTNAAASDVLNGYVDYRDAYAKLWSSGS